MSYSLGLFLTTLYHICFHSSIKRDNWFNTLYSNMIEAYDPKGNLPPELGKNRISDIFKSKRNLLQTLRSGMAADSYKIISANFISWIQPADAALLQNATAEILQKITSADNLSEAQKDTVLSKKDMESALTSAFILALTLDNENPNANRCLLQRNGSNSAYLEFGDIFRHGFGNRKKDPCITVIPVNTTFETHISSASENAHFPLVSEKTLHGMWISRMKKCGCTEEQLCRIIDEGLENAETSSNGSSAMCHGRKNTYPIGTVSAVSHKGNLFYLLAVSQFNQNGNAESDSGSIETALNSLTAYYNRYGQGAHIYIPLIGTGRSRAGMSLQDSFNLICKILEQNGFYGDVSVIVKEENRNDIVFQPKGGTSCTAEQGHTSPQTGTAKPN